MTVLGNLESVDCCKSPEMSLTVRETRDHSAAVREFQVHYAKRELSGDNDDRRKLRFVQSLMSISVGISLMFMHLLISVLVRAFVKLLELTGIKRQDNDKLQVEERRPSINTSSPQQRQQHNLSLDNILSASTIIIPQTTSTPPSRLSPIQMSQEVVEGFEQQQQVAHELSAQVVEEALWATVNQSERESEASEAIMAAVAANGETPVNLRDSSNFSYEKGQKEICRESNLNNENKINPKTQDSSIASVRDEVELDMSMGESLASSHESDEYAGQQASEITLRRLKLSALEDVLVCGRNRQSTESARRLFARLSSQKANTRSPGVEILSVARWHAKTADRHGSSSSSHSSSCDDERVNEEDNNLSQANRAYQNMDYLEDLLGLRSRSGTSQGDQSRLDDCGTIKLDRRCCSSSSSSSGNYGSTLVCSVSPINQIRSSPLAGKSNGDIVAHLYGEDDDLHLYPIDGDEIRQCRTAFRENRRLIERVQDEAFRQLKQQQRDVQLMRRLKRSSSQETPQIEVPKHDHHASVFGKSHWASSLGRRSRLPECSHCGSKLYPLDKMQLDFTRTTLNIHHNCFRCDVCATLLRLETYASIDGKLFCPAHIRCISHPC